MLSRMSLGTALVTGPTAGIGRAFAEALGSRGHDLVLVARDQARLESLAEHLRSKHGVDVEVLAADLADREDLTRVEGRLTDPDRPIAMLVNNAGFGHKLPFTENSVEDEQEMLDVLVTAVLRLTHAAVGPMLARGEGAVVNVSSVAAFLPRGTYSAAKRYVVSFSEWLDLTYRDRGVRGMAVCPGFVRTEFHERMGVGRDSAPAWMWLDADRVVREALHDLDRGKAVSIPSRRYKLLSSVAQYTPSSLQARFQSLGRK
jgi:short-subunit dehydrogenase